MKIAVVTGANGFIGSSVIKELLHNNYKIYAVVRCNHSSRLTGLENIEIVNCEMAEIDRIPELINQKCDVFYHFAWSGITGEERSDVDIQLQNIRYAVNAVNAAHKLGCTRFVFAGSIAEDESLYAAYTGGNRPGTIYVYGAAKAAAHIMCETTAAKLNIDYLSGKIINTYGVGEESARLINSTIRKCIEGISPEFTSGNQNYDFVYIDDVARAFRLIGENGRPFTSYVIGSSAAKPLKEFLLEMKKTIAPAIPFKFGDVSFTGINMPLSTFDCAKTERDTGFRAEISFAEGCRRTYEWWKNKGIKN